VSSARTAIVTGATAGIGLATAEAFAALGWRVAIGARRPERLGPAVAAIEAAGGQGFGHVLDVRDPDSVEAFVAASEEAFGPADALVNNAAGARPGKLHELSVEALRGAVESGLLGALFVTRRVLPGMLSEGRGDIVFVSSRAAVVPWPRHVPYAGAKAGIEGVAAALRAELEGSGIRTTVVRVGDTITEFGAGWTETELAEVGHWVQRGLVKGGVLEARQVAAAITHALTVPAGVALETIVVNPEPPKQAS
jgi:NADP-dependent 3-hydroxy acid dehydrogenase YdfG